MEMKKKRIVAMLLLGWSILSLSSCQVNWFDKHYDLHWWVIAIPTVIFSMMIWIAAGSYIASKKYVCSKCNQTFYPKWWKAAVSVHMGDSRVFKCPQCGEKGFCKPFGKMEE